MPTAPTPVIPPASGSTPDTPTAIVPLPSGAPTAPGGITPAPGGSVSAPGSVVGTPDTTPDLPASIVEVATGTPTAPGSITPLPGGSASAPGSILGAPDAMPDAPAPIVEVASGTPAPPEPASAAPIERSYPAGPPGLSAYEVAVQNGFEGTEEEWLASLVGAGSVRYDQEQGLEATEQNQARANIAAAALEHNHSGADATQWLEGSMHNAMSASLGNNDWMWVPEVDPYRIVYSIDSVLGTGWQSGGGGGGPDFSLASTWYRPYALNKAIAESSPNLTLSATGGGIEAAVTGSNSPTEGLPDGVVLFTVTDLNTSLTGNYNTFPIPATVNNFYWYGMGTNFTNLFSSLLNCPWVFQVNSKFIDLSGGYYGMSTDFLLEDSLQEFVNNWIDSGNTIIFPESNALTTAWIEVPVYPDLLTCTNLVTYDQFHLTRGDGLTEGLTNDSIYTGPVGFESSNEFSEIITTSIYPRRHQENTGFYNIVTGPMPGSDFYVAPRPDYSIVIF